MTIDEAIAHAREVAETCEYEASKYDMCDSYEREVAYKEGKCAREHEQLAEWLEELKAIKSDGFTDNLLNMGFTKGYNKAIDECKSVILQTLDNKILVDTLHLRLEQLKEQSK